MALITSTQLQSFIDVRILCEYLSDSDNGTPVLASSLPTNQYLSDIIESASQDLISACQRAGMYSVNQIVSLAGDQVGGMLPVPTPGTTTVAQSPANLVPITTSKAIIVPGIGLDLRRVVAGLVCGLLIDRRKLNGDVPENLARCYKYAQDKLQQITLGERIWQVPGADVAGQPGVQVLGGGAGPYAIAAQVGLWGNQATPYPWYYGGGVPGPNSGYGGGC